MDPTNPSDMDNEQLRVGGGRGAMRLADTAELEQRVAALLRIDKIPETPAGFHWRLIQLLDWRQQQIFFAELRKQMRLDGVDLREDIRDHSVMEKSNRRRRCLALLKTLREEKP